MKGTLGKHGMLELFIIKQNQTIPTPVSTILYTRIVDIFYQEAWAQIQNENSKLRTYSKIKTIIRKEQYLQKIQVVKHRNALSKLRLSNHKLNIEVGRHKRIAKENRFCPFCVDNIEDEVHFLIECELYKNSRENLWEELHLVNPNFIYYNIDQKFKYLMENENTITKVAYFVFYAFEQREIFVEKLKELIA